jgi:voltage-dependent potassium channel beta subunit
MEYRRLGSAGLKVSQLSYGSWVTFGSQIDVTKASECLAIAYDKGVNFFDNAEVYSGGKSEEVMGAALKKLGWRRGSYLVSTKLFWGLHRGANQKNTLNRKYLLESFAGSLKRLQLDHVDMLFCHRPDPETPLEETVRTMHEIVSSGRALYWGTSEWSASDIAAAWALADRFGWHKPQMEQPEYNLTNRYKVEKEFSKLYTECGLGLTTWSPLASGLLTGKYDNGIPAGSRATLQGHESFKERIERNEGIEKSRKFSALAREVGCLPSQLAIAWCMHKKEVSTVILGASTTEQLKENLGSLEFSPKLDASLLSQLNEIFP